MKRRLGDILVEMSFLEAEQLELALMETRKTGSMLGEVLLRLDWVTEEQLQLAIAVQSGARVLDTVGLQVDPEVVASIPQDFVSEHALFPFAKEGGAIKAATANPFDVVARDGLARLTGMPVHTYLAPRDWVARNIELHYRAALSIDDEVERIAYLGTRGAAFEERHIIGLADLILMKAQVLGASDIHLVPDARLVRVYYRVDGVMRQLYLFPRSFHQPLVVRFKVMANIDISNHNIPHDGRISHTSEAGNFDLRVSTFPTHLGETVVMRMLVYNKVVGDLNALGFEADELARLNRCIQRPYGLIVTTGPTGSGKTTTLFSALMAINSPEINVMTIEDPIEYVVPTIRQTAINPKAGLNFSAALRAAMRQDPDVILVGEIRDQDTAELAVRASITGHLVLSTLHTNDAASSVGRLLDMGISTNLLSAALALVVAQRLLRRVCGDCAGVAELAAADRNLFARHGVAVPASVPQAVGCAKCRGTGYRGRVGIYEMLEVDREVEQLIAEGASRSAIDDAARARGTLPLIDRALHKVRSGLTDMEEVRRVVADA